jgi:hypothetical protein
MKSAGRVTVRGSERTLDPTHRRVGDGDGAQRIEVTHVRDPRHPDWVDEEAARSPAERRILARGEWAGAHQTDDPDLIRNQKC